MKIEIGLVDDHQLFTKALATLIDGFPQIKVTLEACSGEELRHNIQLMERVPDIILLDVCMPEEQGPEVARWIGQHYPSVKIAAVTVNNTDQVIWSMIRAGCCSYLLKNVHPVELEKALHEIAEKGYYNADAANISFRRFINIETAQGKLSDRELMFLALACTDDTYKQIAAKMEVSIRTVDGYRDSVFKKLNVESRTGMVLEAIRRNYIVL